MTPLEIARKLNLLGFKYNGIKRTELYNTAVSRALQNPTYQGMSIHGRTSRKLQRKRIQIPAETWVAIPDSWEAIVTQEEFYQAQQKRLECTCYKSDAQLLDELRAYLSKGQPVSIESLYANGFPAIQTYRTRFGSLTEAFSLAGYPNAKIAALQNRRRNRELAKQLAEKILAFNTSASLIDRGETCRPRVCLANGTLVDVFVCSPNHQGRRMAMDNSEPEAKR